ncbi:MAG TPA: lytic transglycosylase domain-containing protein [Casimicrobiaceae bacterium]
MQHRNQRRRGARRFALRVAALTWLALAPVAANAGTQAEERLAPSVVAGLQRAIADNPVPADYANRRDVVAWVNEMSRRLAKRIDDPLYRGEFLSTVHYEATRAGLDPTLVLGVIHHESGFKKYAVSVASARGYMQVMPFWSRLIGSTDHNLFNLRTNLRYGCVILRHYLDTENGDYFRALGRYNGSLGRAEYPNAVLGAAGRYRFDVPALNAPVVMTTSGAMPR